MTEAQFSEIMTALEVIAEQTKAKPRTVLPGGIFDGPLEPNAPPPKVYEYDMNRYGGAEKFAIQIKQREPGWPESNSKDIRFNCWSREKAGDAVADMIQAFKDDHPELFKKG